MKGKKLKEAEVLSFLDATNHVASGVHADDPLTKAHKRVTLDQLKPYDKNPRQSRNPKYDSILASIETRGLDHPPNISRRHPDDAHYLIVDGGNTRLEILVALYNKYKKLADTAETEQEKRDHLAKAQSFYVIDCLFKPWQSESSTLAGHMSENEERGDTLFIEKALAVQQFREVYLVEDRAQAEMQGETFKETPLTIRALAERITAQGWTVSNSHISRFDYAIKLLPVVPNALWSGAGEPLIKTLRKLEKGYTALWSTSKAGPENQLLDLFFETLAAHDGESVDLDGFTQAMDGALGKRLDLPAMTVRAEVGAFMSGVTRTAPPSSAPEPPPGTSDALPKTPSKTPAVPVTASGESVVVTNKSPSPADHSLVTAVTDQPTTTGQTDIQPATPPLSSSSAPVSTPDIPPEEAFPDTPEALQDAIINTVLLLAVEFDFLIEKKSECDWFGIQPPNVYQGTTLPSPGFDDIRATVWWELFQLSGIHRLLQDQGTLQSALENIFTNYLAEGMSLLDVVMHLREKERRLSGALKTNLQRVSSLVQAGERMLRRNPHLIENLKERKE